MQNQAREPSVDGILFDGSVLGRQVQLRCNSSYLVLETEVLRDVVAIEFLRRTRENGGTRLHRTDRIGWRVISSDLPRIWLSKVRRAGMSHGRRRALWIVAVLLGAGLVMALTVSG